MEKNQNGAERASGGERWREKNILFFSLCFFLRSTKIGPRFSSSLKAKLIHATRATRGYQNLGVSSNSMR